MFARDGVPPALILDGSKEQTLGEFRRKAKESTCHVKTTEPYSPWSNAAEVAIKELKRGAGRKQLKMKSPKRLWDDCLELEALLQSNTQHDIYELMGQVPETVVSGETSDISPFCELGWYEWCYFRDAAIPFPNDKLTLGRYLGPSADTGPAMCAKILKSNGQYAHRSTYRGLTPDEVRRPEEIAARKTFDEEVEEKLGPNAIAADFDMEDPDIETPTYDLYEDAEDQVRRERAEDADDITPEMLDQYVGAEVQLPKGDDMVSGTVRRRKRDRDGNPQGTGNQNPILDTRTYEVEFPDGDVAEYTANVIAQNMWAQCDIDGNQHLLMKDIVDFKTDEHAVAIADQFITRNGRRHMRRTTQGWQLCVLWKDGSTSWERLADLKESHPVDVAEFAVSGGIDHEPASLGGPRTSSRRGNRIIKSVKARLQKRSHKFGIQIPTSVMNAIALDRANGNTLWQESIKKEMDAVKIAFKILGMDEDIPPGYQFIRCHMIFTVKMEDFRRKCRYVAGGHMTEAPATLTYASVVSRETVRIALTLAALNDVEVKASDIQNAYLTAPVTEKIWITCGPEFGPELAGRKALVVRALYGLKSAGAAFRNHLADCMRTMGFSPCLADPDLWYKAETRPDGFEYYAYMLLYVDDCLCVHHDGEAVLNELDNYFKMKDGSIGDPDMYLGTKLRKTTLSNGVVAWGMSPSKYVQEATRNAAEYLEKTFGRKLQKKAPTPFQRDYAPEVDTTPPLSVEQATYYQSQIGVLRWMTEIGRIDIITEVSMLASQLAQPREGHLEAVFHIYSYLHHKHNSRLVFDPTYPEIDVASFKDHEWTDFYGDVKEAIPVNAPAPRGKEVDLRLFVDSDHAGDKMTRRSRTGFLIYMNMSPIVWFSKRQPTIETAVFGAEFVAMKNGMETCRGLRYKLRMMGVQLSGPTFIYGDNMSVIHNTQRPESCLRKKSNSICYHAVRESVAMDESRTTHISTHDNPADICTKVVPGGQKRNHLLSLIMYDLFDLE